MKKKYYFLIFISIVMLILSCGRKNPLSTNQKPVITITSSYGSDNSVAVGDSLLFQQIIYWRGNDYDGTVEGFAFRISNQNGEYLSTPGYNVISDSGWVYHYQEGADTSIPLSDANAQKTIWSDQVYAVINFPANIEGDSSIVVSRFEIKCTDNRRDESNVVTRYFNSYSLIPEVMGSSSKGDIDGKTTGLGINFEFSINDNDPYVGDIADHFKFMLQKRDMNNQIIEEEEYNEWFSTENQDDVYRFYFTQNSHPALIANNFEGTTPTDSTFLIMKAVDLAGIASKPDTISFLIKDCFTPGSMFYIQDTYLLGDNHFVTYRDELISQIIPSEQNPNGIHYSTPFWIDKNGNFTAVNSDDLRIYLHWGWNGEYEENDFMGKFDGAVWDEQTEVPYYTEITHFDLRLDDEAYYFPPLPIDENMVMDNDGKEWLRVPLGHEISQKATLLNLENGEHTFEMRVVDLQGKVDETPIEFTFEIFPPVSEIEKQGVLIIDDDPDHNIFAPDTVIDSIYSAMLGNIDHFEINREDQKNMIDELELSTLHYNKAVLSLTDLQDYKMIIYHSDNLTVNTNFHNEYDVINLYLRNGGNLIFSSGSILKEMQDLIIEENIPILSDYFGLDREEGIINVHSLEDSEANFLRLNFFVKAISEESEFVDLQLQLPSFVNLVNLKEGLGSIAYFENYEAEVMYTYGCKQPLSGSNFEDWDDENDIDQFPSEEQFNEINGKVVALRKSSDTGNCYIFGFPLSFMEVDNLQLLLDQILEEID